MTTFIETESIEMAGKKDEQRVWEALKRAYAKDDGVGYWRYPVFSPSDGPRREPDLLLLTREGGLVIIEVKGLTIDQIASVQGPLWTYDHFYVAEGAPYQQAEDQLFSLLHYFDRDQRTRRKIKARAIVALPRITRAEWEEKGFADLPSSPPILFAEDLGPKTMRLRIEEAPTLQRGRMPLDDEAWNAALSVLGGAPVHQKKEVAPTATMTKSYLLHQLNAETSQFDQKQESIGKVIPPGPQRIRGIAGSGKTVMLCQKAAHMHLKHPEWDIAIVFSTQSLYDSIRAQVDHWLRFFSNDTVSLTPEVERRIRIFHAWGGKRQPGFYSTLARQHGVRPLTVNDIKKASHLPTRMSPSDSVAYCCQQLLHETGGHITPQFDAILIDEGQDLVVENKTFHYEGKQPIYWLAFQALRPAIANDPTSRRLIWGYDESQSLDALIVPTAKELFGPDYTKLVQGIYPGGARKSEVMYRCYRTPGPLLTAAHAIGMGLLRPDGMLRGITNKSDWERIGYEVVHGNFRSGEEITLHRPPAHSPNPVPSLWEDPILHFQTYTSTTEELRHVAQAIIHDVTKEGIEPEDILVIFLGAPRVTRKKQQQLGQLLNDHSIDFYVAAAKTVNETSTSYGDPTRFVFDGAVTFSQVTRAKGNEANMVYVVGLDEVAKKEDSPKARNELFVALTRSRAWAHVSGIDTYPFYEEFQKVLQSGDTFTFSFKQPPPYSLDRDESE